MTTQWAGGELDAWTASDGNVTEVTVDPGGGGLVLYDSTYARCAIQCGPSASYAQTGLWAAAADSWFGWTMLTRTFPASGYSPGNVTFYNASGTGIARLAFSYASTGAVTVQPQTNVSGTWTNAGASFTVADATRTRWDVRLKVNSVTGVFAVYTQGSLRTVSGATVDLSAYTTGMAFARIGNGYTNTYGMFVSEGVAADTPTIGWRVLTSTPTGNSGTNTGFTGGFGNINEVVTNDANSVAATVAGNVATYTSAALGVTQYLVRSVVVMARGKHDVTGPQNIQLALRISTTNYFSATKSLDYGYAPVFNCFDLSPATGIAFTVAEASGCERGVKAIA